MKAMRYASVLGAWVLTAILWVYEPALDAFDPAGRGFIKTFVISAAILGVLVLAVDAWAAHRKFER